MKADFIRCACSRINDPWRRHCGGCGKKLEPGCKSCGFINSKSDQFCGGCGTSVSQTRRTVAGTQEPSTIPIDLTDILS